MADTTEDKLQILINLQARALVREIDTQTEKVAFLADCGLSNPDIANVLGTSSGSVSVMKAKIKKERDKDQANVK